MEEFEPKDGVFAVPMPKDSIRYNIAALFQHCKEKGIEPNTLSQEEKKQFIVK